MDDHDSTLTLASVVRQHVTLAANWRAFLVGSVVVTPNAAAVWAECYAVACICGSPWAEAKGVG